MIFEAAFGERKAIVENEDWDGPDFQTCANAAAVSRKVETSRRRDVLTFNHHAEVAGVLPSEADALLEGRGRAPAQCGDAEQKP